MRENLVPIAIATAIVGGILFLASPSEKGPSQPTGSAPEAVAQAARNETPKQSPPSYGASESSFAMGLGAWVRRAGAAAVRGAMRSAARRRGAGGERLTSEGCCSSLHHLISGRTQWSVPTFRMLAVRKP
jgi:hypothetical protein